MSDDTSASEPDSAHDWFPLDELTTRLAELVWVEQQLAAVMAEWAQTTDQADVAVAFARAGGHHAWHAELLGEALATSPALAAGDRIAAPTAGWKRAVDQLRSVEQTRARLAAISRLVGPWLEREIGALRGLANPVSDRDHDRLLGFVSLDHDTDHEGLQQLFESLDGGAIDLAGRRDLAEIDLL